MLASEVFYAQCEQFYCKLRVVEVFIEDRSVTSLLKL